jgi:ApaG protein
MPDTNKYQIEIQPLPQYVPDQSDPDNGRYVFTYTVIIKNVGEVAAQLVSRHWIITDGNNEQPGSARPRRRWQTTATATRREFSNTPAARSLTTPIGTMKGSYQMVAEDGTHFSCRNS